MIIIYSLILVVLIFLSMFFSSADMAFGSVSYTRLEKLNEANPTRKRSRAIRLAKKYDKTISTILFFNDLVNAGLDSISTLLGILIASQIMNLSNQDYIESIGLIFSLVVLVFKIIFGEIIAKSVGKIKSYRMVDAYSFIIEICYYISLPITFLVGGLGSSIAYPIVKGIKDIEIVDDDLHEMVDEIEESGIVDEDKADLLRDTIDYATTEAYEVMTPRTRLFLIDKNDSLDEILSHKKAFNFSRVPVYEDNSDNIVGYVKSKSLIKLKLEGKTQDISSIIEPIPFFPRTTEINDILKYFKLHKVFIAVIIDEYGGTEGIVTREDILEEIVGEIWDETDENTDIVNENSDGSYYIDGSMNLEDFCDLFNIDFDNIDTEYVTIGG
ncbi:MAG: hemolysin family protein, partial [Bacilli bacterium]